MFLYRIRLIAKAISQLFKLAQHRRERLALERREAREHELQVLETIFSKLTETIAQQNVAQQRQLETIVEPMKAQSEVLMTWLKGFQADSSPRPSETVVEDEWEPVGGEIEDLPAGLPPEFALAFTLMANADIDREGSDF